MWFVPLRVAITVFHANISFYVFELLSSFQLRKFHRCGWFNADEIKLASRNYFQPLFSTNLKALQCHHYELIREMLNSFPTTLPDS